MGTLHASYPRDTLTRPESMAMMSDVQMPLAAVRAQIGSGIQLIVHVVRLPDGSRKVTRITEVLGFELASEEYEVQDKLVRCDQGLGQKGSVISEFVPTGILTTFMHQLEEHGVTLPDPVLDAARRAPANAQYLHHG